MEMLECNSMLEIHDYYDCSKSACEALSVIHMVAAHDDADEQCFLTDIAHVGSLWGGFPRNISHDRALARRGDQLMSVGVSEKMVNMPSLIVEGCMDAETIISLVAQPELHKIEVETVVEPEVEVLDLMPNDMMEVPAKEAVMDGIQTLGFLDLE
jgi:hypothetical protein